MNTNELRTYCLTPKGAADVSPEGENNFIIKVVGKIFAYTEEKLLDNQPFGIMLKSRNEPPNSAPSTKVSLLAGAT
ncbi:MULTISPECIES: hypothetical protein [Parabacteroides]|uniref:hypothetical protein n=1 Tax=Parabacteroides leei TaxID=2939491 RepID=UPI001E47EFFD|nr:hypothetical protein [Parabacteroides goldsteinii]